MKQVRIGHGAAVRAAHGGVLGSRHLRGELLGRDAVMAFARQRDFETYIADQALPLLAKREHAQYALI